MSLENLPKLKHLWNKDPQGNIRFRNLFTVKAAKCQSLKHVFPLSVAEDLVHLQFLEISDCWVEEIIANDQGGIEAALGFVFPKLVSINILNFSSFCMAFLIGCFFKSQLPNNPTELNFYSSLSRLGKLINTKIHFLSGNLKGINP